MRKILQIRKLALVLACAVSVAQLPMSYVSATETKAVQETGTVQETTAISADKSSLIPNNITAEGQAITQDSNGFTIYNGVLLSYTGSAADITIPDEVKTIANNAFLNCSTITSIKMPEVTTIEYNVFNGCSKLVSVDMPKVTTIGQEAFTGCSKLASVSISKLTIIEEKAFNGCSSLAGIDMPEVTTIGENAFYGCSSLASIKMPKVIDIGRLTFKGCSGLADSNGLVIIKGIVYDYVGSKTSLTMPDGVTTIGDIAFQNNSSIINVTIPDGVTTMGNAVFYDCSNLASVIIPDSVYQFGDYVFQNCNKLIISCHKNSSAHTYAVLEVIPFTFLLDSINLNKDMLNLTKGERETITMTVLPEDAGNKNVIWTSSDSSVATVDSSGFVTAVGGGTATITVQAEDGSKVATSCAVNVIEHVEAVNLNKASIEITKGQTETLSATILSDKATNKNITWTSSDSSVATVDNTGKVTAVSAGTTTITVTSEDGNKTASCNVTVKNIPVQPIGQNPAAPTLVPVETATGKTVGTVIHSMKLNTTKVTLGKKASINLVATISPENATNTTVVWTSSNTNVATVSSTGKVTAKAAGTAVITASAQDGSNVTSSCTVTVSKNKSYKITYKLNKGTNAATNPTYYAKGLKLKLENPTRKGYTFASWYIGEDKISSVSKTKTGKLTLTAKWTKVSVDKTTVASVKNNKAGTLSISFDKVSSAKGYTVYYSIDKKLTNATSFDVSSKKKSSTITNLQEKMKYYVTVKAYKTDSQGNRVYGKSNKVFHVTIKK